MLPDLTIVVPCYNEEDALPTTARILREKIMSLIAGNHIGSGSKILFVDDGSSDKTWAILSSLCESDKTFSGMKLSRNVGHQNALIAGLQQVSSDICVSIDADLQDDVDAIDKMVEEYARGYQIVYGVRSDRSSDTIFKRKAAKMFYSTLSRLGVESIDNHADFRLMSLKSLKALLSFGESNAYIRGMVPLIGFPSTSVYYERKARMAGESKYPLSKMLALAIRAVTSLSVVPLRIIAIFGFIISFLAGTLSIWILLNKFLSHPVQGWASTTIIIFFMGGVQMLAIGILGEYIGCIYLEVKRRPKYFVEEMTK